MTPAEQAIKRSTTNPDGSGTYYRSKDVVKIKMSIDYSFDYATVCLVAEDLGMYPEYYAIAFVNNRGESIEQRIEEHQYNALYKTLCS